MNYFVANEIKGDQLHIRIKPDVKDDLKIVADVRGLTMSSFVYSLIVQDPCVKIFPRPPDLAKSRYGCYRRKAKRLARNL
jgi:hypothetical protein